MPKMYKESIEAMKGNKQKLKISFVTVLFCTPHPSRKIIITITKLNEYTNRETSG